MAKEFVCALCDRYVVANSKYDKKVLDFVSDFGADIDEFDDSGDVCVIARCKHCEVNPLDYISSEPAKSSKPVKIEFQGRDTGKGAYTQYHIFSLRQRKELRPHRTESSRTGNHWTDIWWLLPGIYFVCWHNISNSGNHECGYGRLVVSDSEFSIKEWEGAVPEFAKDALCKDCFSKPTPYY